MRTYIVEGIGTFALTALVALSLNVGFPISTPILAAILIGLFTYTIGAASGAHLNPAITIGAWSIGNISTKSAFAYIAGQLVGATYALIVTNSFVGISFDLQRIFTANNAIPVGIAEMFGAFFFSFGVASVIYQKTQTAVSGLIVGGSFFIGTVFATLMGSMAILNPAVALGTGSINFMYVLGPIVGAVVGMWCYRLIVVVNKKNA